jgi:hypothetical protein
MDISDRICHLNQGDNVSPWPLLEAAEEAAAENLKRAARGESHVTRVLPT